MIGIIHTSVIVTHIRYWHMHEESLPEGMKLACCPPMGNPKWESPKGNKTSPKMHFSTINNVIVLTLVWVGYSTV